ncbi:MAG: bifunctional aspartate kinase/homoserine dehydrogenase I [Ignavibacteriaceae bacterium]|nr:bifunctional aspartate kinase/homoserine dehydrogenase I [Ignavibacteriaceae bacterium]
MRILKFGGSSVGTPDRIIQVIEILKTYIDKKLLTAVVFSAFQGVTDNLILLAKKAVAGDKSYLDDIEKLQQRHLSAVEKLIPAKNKLLIKKILIMFDELKELNQGVFLLKELTNRTMDNIVSFGERLSNIIIAESMLKKGFDVEYLDARNIIKTDSNFGNAKVDFKTTNKSIVNYFKSHKHVQIVTGFIGSNSTNETTTLGRGGSDYTASILGAALNSDLIEIWTDVDGILTADPKKVGSAFPIKAVTYEEAMELSHFGAKVIYPPTMQPALEKKIKLVIKNTFNPKFKGTLILERQPNIAFSVKGTSSIDDITLLTITGSGMIGVPGIASRLFNSLAKRDISVIMITQGSSEHTICIAVLPQYGLPAKNAIEEEFAYELRDRIISKVIIEEGNSVVAVVAEDFRRTPRVAGRVVQALGSNGINILCIAQGSSDLNISLVIRKESLKKALNVLHDTLFTQVPKTTNLFMIGTGLVGGELFKLINEEQDNLEKNLNNKLKFIGIANSEKMLFDESGINISNWQTLLRESTSKSSVPNFIDKMNKLNLPNTIFIDCTANEAVIPFYEKILGDSVSIVTPNKIANSSTINYYNKIRAAAKRNNVQFLYETNVCSAMPVIKTLNEMVASGDEVLKIEGVLSGTLSYIFNEMKQGKKFSSIVEDAKQKGYTEPDPRDDLNGLDVARKILILAREVGAQIEITDVEVEKLIPQELMKIKMLDQFMLKLKSFDKVMNVRRTKAAKKGKVLCYVASYENGKAKVGVQEIGNEHPFYNLSGIENIVSITSKYFNKKPLVLRGMGAGARLTASGVLSDILKVSNQLGKL